MELFAYIRDYLFFCTVKCLMTCGMGQLCMFIPRIVIESIF